MDPVCRDRVPEVGVVFAIGSWLGRRCGVGCACQFPRARLGVSVGGGLPHSQPISPAKMRRADSRCAALQTGAAGPSRCEHLARHGTQSAQSIPPHPDPTPGVCRKRLTPRCRHGRLTPVRRDVRHRIRMGRSSRPTHEAEKFNAQSIRLHPCSRLDRNSFGGVSFSTERTIVKPFAVVILAIAVLAGARGFGQESPGKDRKAATEKPAGPKIKITASAPTLRKVETDPDSTCVTIKVQLKNEGKVEVVLSPWFNVKVADAANQPVKSDTFVGRGMFPEDFLQGVEKMFLTVGPGKSVELTVNLNDVSNELEVRGWKFKQPGTYKIELEYLFERKKFNADYGKYIFAKTPADDDEALVRFQKPERLWNRAVEVKQSVTVEVKVSK